MLLRNVANVSGIHWLVGRYNQVTVLAEEISRLKSHKTDGSRRPEIGGLLYLSCS